MAHMISEADVAFMTLALAEAQKAAEEEETPIGAVVVKNGKVLVAAHNKREAWRDIAAHAELIAIREAEKQLGDWRLSDCTVYITLEPCPMCAGALLAARVGRVVYGARDPVAGAFGTVVNLPRYPLGSNPAVTAGVMEAECRRILQDFFRARRK